MASKAHREGMTTLRAAPAVAMRCTGRTAPPNSTAGKAQHRQRERRLGDVTDRGRGEQAEAEGSNRTQQQAHLDGGVRRQRAIGEAVQCAKDTQHRHDHHEEERDEDGHLRRHVRPDAQADEAFAVHDRALGADLQQAVGEAEEERGEDDPEPDHHHRARAGVPEVEGTGPEEHREHTDDQGRRREQDRERQRVADERLERPAGEDMPLREPACDRSLVHLSVGGDILRIAERASRQPGWCRPHPRAGG